ncbi:MAG: cytidine deaminase [Bacteroidales bacterium]|jgi:cytidine deaminase|nr:cytidine deaminase [Bacteroidales bacterium]
MKQESKQINYKELQKRDLTPEQSQLIDLAKEAIKSAYTPYSNFQVGAAVLLDNGEIVTGSNQENAAYPSGLCAERVALFSAHHLYPTASVKALAIAATDKGKALVNPIMPCGACVQVMSESISRGKHTFEILLQGEAKTVLIPNALDLIPFRFEF